ncbi:MAG: hypothetical protein EPN37_04500 [Chitinophagaceae bacterium]|nr:MAG: hypothetical protein EPN37_04500 [Chitinophagaceae bacterium]
MEKEQLKHLFKSYPKAKSFHVTSDGFAFEVKDHAHDHAGKLKDKEVREFHREDLEYPEDPKAVEEAEENDTESVKDKKGKK